MILPFLAHASLTSSGIFFFTLIKTFRLRGVKYSFMKTLIPFRFLLVFIISSLVYPETKRTIMSRLALFLFGMFDVIQWYVDDIVRFQHVDNDVCSISGWFTFIVVIDIIDSYVISTVILFNFVLKLSVKRMFACDFVLQRLLLGCTTALWCLLFVILSFLLGFSFGLLVDRSPDLCQIICSL